MSEIRKYISQNRHTNQYQGQSSSNCQRKQRLDFFSFSYPNCTKHKEEFYSKLSDHSSKESIFRYYPYSQRDADQHSYQVDWQKHILFIYCDKEIIIYLFDEAPQKHYTEKRKYLVWSPGRQGKEASEKGFSWNHENNLICKQSEIDSNQSSYPENKQEKIAYAFAFIYQGIIGYLMEQAIA